MTRTLAAIVLAVACASCQRSAFDPPPRFYMQGGVWWPAATGYWFHQYAIDDDIERLMADLGFACVDAAARDGARWRCERGFRVPGLLARTDFVEFAFRKSGVVALAESGCRFVFFGTESLAGTCAPYMARGAVYPDLGTWKAMVEAMLRPLPVGHPGNAMRLPPRKEGPLPSVEAAVDRLAAWRFDCDAPHRHATGTFRGWVGATTELVCRQSSLRTSGGAPQRQEVVLRYDSADLSVLAASVRLDGETAELAPSWLTPRNANVRPGEPPLALETIAGERFEIPYSAIGTGSRQQTREAFVTLTPQSQRALVQAYLDKTSRAWRSPLERLSQAQLASLEWYGPDALPHLDAIASDAQPDLGAAILKFRCFLAPEARNGDDQDAMRTIASCLDARRASMPQSLATLDRLLAADLRPLARMDARALNAYQDFRYDAIYVAALGPDAAQSAAALQEVVEGKAGLDRRLTDLVAAVQPPRPSTPTR